MRIDRRDFMKFSAGGVIGTAVAGLTVKGLSDLTAATHQEVLPSSGPERWVPSICGQCAGGCGILVRMVGDRAIKIEGNPLHPINRGTLCPRGQAALQALYNPDRTKGPLRRVGERGSGRWQPIGWDQAIGLVAEHLGQQRQRGESRSLVWISGRRGGLVRRLTDRFLEAYGSPNVVDSPTGLETAQAGLYATQGVRQGAAYDLERTNYILSFGANLLEGWGAPVWVMRAYGAWRQGRSEGRARFIQTDTRLSVTAARADEWIPVNPGTDGALALGIAYAILTERLYDEEFIERRTLGFDDWVDEDGRPHLGFKNLVLREYSLEAVERITGVPLETILRVGREFGSTRPAIAVGGSHGSLYDQMAIHSLNALVGSIDIPGGVLVQKEIPYNAWPPVVRDSAAATGGSAPRVSGPGAIDPASGLSQAILSDKPYRVNTLIVDSANPVMREGAAFRDALRKVSLVVSLSPWMDETAAQADLILPDHLDLERWEDVPTPPGINSCVFGMRQPVVPPRHNTRHAGDLIISVARELGSAVASAFPWSDFTEVLKDSVRGLYESQRGYVAGTQLDQAWNQLLERAGWWAPSYQSADELYEQMVEKGGWWDPFYYYGEWERLCPTRSGRFEFYARNLSTSVPSVPDTDRSFLPHYAPPTPEDDVGSYPFFLNPYTPLPLLSGAGANQPFLQEILGPHLHEQWESWAEINPVTAQKLGISDRSWIWVESPVGKLKFRAKLYAGAMPTVVNVPIGLGRRSSGRWADGVGANPYDIEEKSAGRRNGLSPWSPTRVRIYRA